MSGQDEASRCKGWTRGCDSPMNPSVTPLNRISSKSERIWICSPRWRYTNPFGTHKLRKRHVISPETARCDRLQVYDINNTIGHPTSDTEVLTITRFALHSGVKRGTKFLLSITAGVKEAGVNGSR